VHGRKATGWWRLAAYGSSSGLEESAQGGDLEERVERHVVVICARAGGHCGATRREWAQGLGAGAAALWPCVRVEGVLGSVFEAFAFLTNTATKLQDPQTLIGPRGRKPGRPAMVKRRTARSFRSAPQAAPVWLGGRQERRDVYPQAAARQERHQLLLRRVTCGTPRSAADARNVRLDLGLGRSKCQRVPHRAARSRNGNNNNNDIKTSRIGDRCLAAAGARAHVTYSPNVNRSRVSTRSTRSASSRQRNPTTTSLAAAWVNVLDTGDQHVDLFCDQIRDKEQTHMRARSRLTSRTKELHCTHTHTHSVHLPQF